MFCRIFQPSFQHPGPTRAPPSKQTGNLIISLTFSHWGRMKPGAKKIHHKKKVHHIIIWLIFFNFAENQNHPLRNLRENVISIFYLMENIWKFLSNMWFFEVFCHLCSKYIKYPYSIIHFLKHIIKAHLIFKYVCKLV